MSYNDNSIIGFLYLNGSSTTNVAAGNSYTYDIQPPEGQFYQLVSLDCHAADPAGSSAGTHDFTAAYEHQYYKLFRSKSTTGNQCVISPMDGFIGDSSENPTDYTDQLNKISGGSLYASYDEILSITYNNDTDVSQTGTITIKAFVIVRKQVI